MEPKGRYCKDDAILAATCYPLNSSTPVGVRKGWNDETVSEGDMWGGMIYRS